jgi:hypothetical protein
MLASSADIAEFMTKIKDKPFHDVVYLVDREATEAERLTLKSKSVPESETDIYRRYAMTLKDFVLYVRHGIKTSLVSNLDLDDFQNLHYNN